MRLQKLNLVNFRNFNKLDLEFTKNIICFTGLNGQGKTNVVESVALLSNLTSFRTSIYSDMAGYGDNYFSATGKFKNRTGRTIDVRIGYNGKTKKIFVDNKKLLRYSEMWGKIPLVYLIPDENIITSGAPAYRRDFLDRLLSMADNEYFKLISDYSSVVKQKNKMLSKLSENFSHDSTMLNVYNTKISNIGFQIFDKRKVFLENFLVFFKEIFKTVTDGLYEGDINYISGSDLFNYEASTSERLKKYHKDEIRRRVSLVGPHRDDLEFLIDGRQLKKYGSKGQHKLFLVSLKLAEIEYVKSVTDEYPIFILDDLYSEIDEKKSDCVARILDKEVQTFVTTSNFSMVSRFGSSSVQVFGVENGKCKVL